MNLYRYIPIFHRFENGLRLYRVFEKLGHGFFVQSCDFLHVHELREQRDGLDHQMLELLIEEAPETRAAQVGAATIEDAIAAFDANVSDEAQCMSEDAT